MEKIDHISNKIKTPDAFSNLKHWQVNRRAFLRSTMIAGAASQIALFTSCSAQLEEANEFLTAEQSTILKSVLLIILPDDGNGPSADDLNSFGYIMWVLSDGYRQQKENEFIIEGLDWANDTAQEIYGENYFDLSEKEQQKLVKLFTEMDYGENWMNVMVSLSIESLISDPIYGGNKDELGWKWLNHVPGNPRASEKTRYDVIMQKFKPLSS